MTDFTYAFAAHDLVAVLGGPRVVREPVQTYMDLMDLAAEGLPRAALTAVAVGASPNAGAALTVRRQIIPDATWKRRTTTLKADESDRTLRLARIVALTRFVWHNDAATSTTFLNAPHSMLNGRTPLDCATTDAGAQAVEAVLMRLLHGVAA